ncbi:hypothetical protein [Rathayibacter sp. AY1D9]|uniref:hypothetical protein n=1 Tax=Rathayibacter sp. AY1D9 TaxID=2080548 RepID=UPI0015E2AA05|nr:hypothetical protein [Rathayibacter sp. AY1D9]
MTSPTMEVLMTHFSGVARGASPALDHRVAEAMAHGLNVRAQREAAAALHLSPTPQASAPAPAPTQPITGDAVASFEAGKGIVSRPLDLAEEQLYQSAFTSTQTADLTDVDELARAAGWEV